MTTKLLFLAGSARKNSVNKNLAKSAYQMAIKQGALATYVDLGDFPMPIYDGDLENASGLPEKAIELKQLFIEHDGIFIASPEYNSAYSPLLKNSLDWISRPHQENEPPLSAYRNKVAAIAAASPGGLGGIRGLVPLRMMLGNISVLVLPEQIAIANSMQAFDEQGNLTHDGNKKTLLAIVKKLITVSSNNNVNV